MASVYIVRRKTATKGERFHVRCETGRNDAIVHLGSFGSQREANARVSWARDELAAGRIPDRRAISQGGTRLSEVCDSWVGTLLDLAPKTRVMYEQRARRISDDLGGRVASRMTRDDVQAWLRDLSDEGMAAGTVNQYLVVLRLIFDHADLRENPARDRRIRAPRGVTRVRIRLPTRAHLAAVRAELPEHYHATLQLLERGGFRISEAHALDWPDPDRLRLLVLVSKGNAPRRYVDDLGDEYGGDGALLAGLDRPLVLPKQRAFVTALEKAVEKAQVPRFSAHDLRHLHASRLLHAGMPPASLAARLGHANVGITLSRYSHVPPPD